MFCKVCGVVDNQYDENSLVDHFHGRKHASNKRLETFKTTKNSLSKNRDGIMIVGYAETDAIQGVEKCSVEITDHQKIRIAAKPSQKVKFSFIISNIMKKEDVVIEGIHLPHPQPQFQIHQNFSDKYVLETKTTVKDQVYVTFVCQQIGIYEMPIVFTFKRKHDDIVTIIIRDMVVSVYEEKDMYINFKSPYSSAKWERADHTIACTNVDEYPTCYKIPKILKILLPCGLDEENLLRVQVPKELKEELYERFYYLRGVFDEGPTKANYSTYFHNLLWWEEIISRINIRRYNMSNVKLAIQKDNFYYLEVPGLAERRPSLLRGDRVFIRVCDQPKLVFGGKIFEVKDFGIEISNIDPKFKEHYNKNAFYDIRFLMSRIAMERAHEAVDRLFSSKQESRIFLEEVKQPIPVKPITKFFNSTIMSNEEQKSAVEHILSGSSGKSPYILFGPPGTGKTITIVEAILQLVTCNRMNKIMVCTDSNMAADHIAVMLLKYNESLKIPNFLLRANSECREWSVMPLELAAVSNGSSFKTFFSVNNKYVSKYRIVVTTLLHAAKYGQANSQAAFKLEMSHVFIDEAAQASEPAALIPISGLLSPTGYVVLAGDPQQLGPVCVSKEAKIRGLGVSLLERLKKTYDNLYNDNRNYITMLVKNFRSDPDILAIPNELFYNSCLKTMAKLDPLSKMKILLDHDGGERAIVFHAINSKEQRMGNAPSFFNEMELDMLKKYIKALVNDHKVNPKDIGVITPYIRQVYKMKSWLKLSQYKDIEVGTVESFQGKEKRVILVSTVRANNRLLDYDATYRLGFLVDDKRFNVTLTRAKAKLVIIGNPACLTRDIKWRLYMDLCANFKTYCGQDSQQLTRTADLLYEVAFKRLNDCLLTEDLPEKK